MTRLCLSSVQSLKCLCFLIITEGKVQSFLKNTVLFKLLCVFLKLGFASIGGKSLHVE